MSQLLNGEDSEERGVSMDEDLSDDERRVWSELREAEVALERARWRVIEVTNARARREHPRWLSSVAPMATPTEA